MIEEGEAGMKPKPGDIIVAHYIGKLTDGTIFDQSNDHGGPIQVEIGVGNVMDGLDIAIQAMNVGEVAGLLIDSKYGYGKNGNGTVPPDSTLLFLIQLLDIIEPE